LHSGDVLPAIDMQSLLLRIFQVPVQDRRDSVLIWALAPAARAQDQFKLLDEKEIRALVIGN